MRRILFAWLALATLALLTGSAHAQACPLRTITARISRKKITAPSTAKLTVKVTNLERQGIQNSLMAVTLPANVYVIKTSARPRGNGLGNNVPVARTINSVTWSANFTEKGTRSYRFRVNITACAPDNLSFQASTYTLVNGVRSCDLDAAPAQASIVKRKADTSGCAAAAGPQRFGAPGQKCADSGAQTPSGITTLDECFTFCAYNGPQTVVPFYFNWLATGCQCLGNTCTLVPARRQLAHETDRSRTLQSDEYGAYQAEAMPLETPAPTSSTPATPTPSPTSSDVPVTPAPTVRRTFAPTALKTVACAGSEVPVGTEDGILTYYSCGSFFFCSASAGIEENITNANDCLALCAGNNNGYFDSCYAAAFIDNSQEGRANMCLLLTNADAATATAMPALNNNAQMFARTQTTSIVQKQFC